MSIIPRLGCVGNYYIIILVRYLKTWILPILEGNGIIQMKQVLRESTPSAAAAAPSEKGKESTNAAPAASSTAPQKTERLWAWVLVDPIEVPQSKQDPTSKTPADIDPILFNLDSQRKRKRFEKAVNYYMKMRDAELKEGGRSKDDDFERALDYYQKTQVDVKKSYRHRRGQRKPQQTAQGVKTQG